MLSISLPDNVVMLIGELSGLQVPVDAPRREGELCFGRTSLEWQRLTRGGRHRLTQAAHKRDNARVGSSFNLPILDIPCVKQNNGIMHTPCGHQNHFWVSIGDAIKAKMEGCDWQVRLANIEGEVDAKIKNIEVKIKHCQAGAESKIVKAKIRRVRKDAKTATGPDKVVLTSLEEEFLEKLRDLSGSNALGDYNLIHAGLKELEVLLKARPKSGSKRPTSDLQYVLWKTVESRAGGRLDMKMSGLDQTNRAGLVSVQNCRKVFAALLGMYSSDTEEHRWLSEEVVKWGRLGDAIFDIGCFLKSQRKRSPTLFDEKLLRLWCRWEDAFPGKSFNKFHGIFCTI